MKNAPEKQIERMGFAPEQSRRRREALLGRPVEGRQSGRAASLPQAGTPYPILSFAASSPESSTTTTRSSKYTKGGFSTFIAQHFRQNTRSGVIIYLQIILFISDSSIYTPTSSVGLNASDLLSSCLEPTK